MDKMWERAMFAYIDRIVRHEDSAPDKSNKRCMHMMHTMQRRAAKAVRRPREG